MIDSTSPRWLHPTPVDPATSPKWPVCPVITDRKGRRRGRAVSSATIEQANSVWSAHSHDAPRAGSASGLDALRAVPRRGIAGALRAGPARKSPPVRDGSGQASARAPSGGSGGYSSAPGTTGRERASTRGSGAAAAAGNGGGVPP